MPKSIAWLVGVGLLLLGLLSIPLAIREGVFTALSAGAFILAGAVSLPPTGPPLWRLLTGKQPTTTQQLWVVFLLSSIAIGALATQARL